MGTPSYLDPENGAEWPLTACPECGELHRDELLVCDHCIDARDGDYWPGTDAPMGLETLD